MFQNIKHNSSQVKTSYYFNDFKQRKMALSCSEKIISIFKRSNTKK